MAYVLDITLLKNTVGEEDVRWKARLSFVYQLLLRFLFSINLLFDLFLLHSPTLFALFYYQSSFG